MAPDLSSGVARTSGARELAERRTVDRRADRRAAAVGPVQRSGGFKPGAMWAQLALVVAAGIISDLD